MGQARSHTHAWNSSPREARGKFKASWAVLYDQSQKLKKESVSEGQGHSVVLLVSGPGVSVQHVAGQPQASFHDWDFLSQKLMM